MNYDIGFGVLLGLLVGFGWGLILWWWATTGWGYQQGSGRRDA